MLKAVLFDFDGVIIDSHGTINSLFTKYVNNAFRLNITPDEFAFDSGTRFEKRIEKLAGIKGVEIPKSEIEKVVEQGRRDYYENSLSYLEVYPGTEKLFEMLKDKGIKIGLGTNGSKKTVMKILKLKNLEKYFDSIATFDDVKMPKPSPDVFLLAAEKIGVNPKECAIVEDSVEGLIAGKSAGMKTIAVSTTTPKDLLKKHADFVLDTIADITIDMLK